MDIKFDRAYEITVSSIASPYRFYVQIEDFHPDFVEFENALQKHYEKQRLQSGLVLLEQPQLGQICVAKCCEKNQWYRARIDEIYEHFVRVFFIDYGKEEIISIYGNLLLLHKQFSLFPHMAVSCCLNGIKPLPDASLNDIDSFLLDLMMGKLVAKFIQKVIFGSNFNFN